MLLSDQRNFDFGYALNNLINFFFFVNEAEAATHKRFN